VILSIPVLILAACMGCSSNTPFKGEELPESPPDSCPVTGAPQPRFTPPSPFPRWPDNRSFWYGTPELWTAVPVSHSWENLPHDEHGYTQKVLWWNENYFWRNEPQPDLMVTGKRLDAPAPPLVASNATNGFHGTLQSFMLVGVEIPTPGCWEITAEYKGDELSFVVWVAP
jgi:hypothetical protein